MAKIHELSNEILYQILSHFPTRSRDIKNICSTSRLLYAVAIPIYISCYTYRRKPKRGSAAYFVSGLLHHQTSVCIREIHLENWTVRRHPLGAWSYLTDEKTRECLCRAADEFPFPSDIMTEWKTALNDALDDAVFALLLFLADGLEKLTLWLPFTGSNQTLWVFRLLREVPEIPASIKFRGFEKLRHIHLGNSNSDMFFNLNLFLPLFRLPALQSFQAVRCIGSSDTCSWDWPQGISPVESIIFGSSQLDAGSIHILFGACRGIKEFSLHWCRSTGHMIGNKLTDWKNKEFDLCVLEAALRSQAASMETFEFVDESYMSPKIYYNRDSPPQFTAASHLLCLVEFPHLESAIFPRAWL